MPARAKARPAQESPLDWLRRRKGPDGAPLIGEGEYEAGERLRLDYARAGLMPRSGVDFEAGPQSGSRRGARGPVEVLDAALDARDRVNRALDHVGSDLSGMLVDVCCHLKSLGEVEAERGWPKRSAKVVLDIGLSRLSRHYGLQSQAVGPRRAGKTRSWGGEGYRPDIA
ncbi:DUF6456 domain-containing protein [Tepidamorphus sp. 3E244]|uniref:DUF6456 domain-containing protein n=1 Tax=Tepidamorphus sp. 3E244 TaxID=3385498 RepID=UPI0038FBEDF0